VLIVERLIADDPADALPVLLSDLNMLVFTGGQERTNTEYGHLLAAAGLSLANVQPVAAPYGVIEGTQPEPNTGKPARDNTQADQFCAHRSRRGHTALAIQNEASLRVAATRLGH
jgi:hypothetical protein